MKINWLVIPFMVGCTAHHEHHTDLYIHKQKLYTSLDAGEFELKHFKKYSSGNVVILSSPSFSSKSEMLSAFCKKYEVDCRFLVLDDVDIQSYEKVKTLLHTFGSEKIMLVAFDPTVRALAVMSYAGLSGETVSEELLREELKVLQQDDVEKLLAIRQERS